MKNAIILFILWGAVSLYSSSLIYKHNTFETDHFRVHYPEDLFESAREIAKICEDLYEIYRTKYGITLPTKTEVIVSNKPYASWALAIQNTISIEVGAMDFNMRGNGRWLEDVIAHEYAHIVSISASFKLPSWMPYIQYGSFTHPNEKSGFNGLYIFPSEILPPWFFEGIAQYESMKMHGDRWDSHRDMILRTMILEDNLMSWDHMSVFRGQADDFEKVYNHGFSIVKYIASTYGENSLKAIIRESARFGRLSFDNSIKAVLGISGRELYNDWKNHLLEKYRDVASEIGKTSNYLTITEGFNNERPLFSECGNYIYFLSNGEGDTYNQSLMRYSFSDTLEEKERTKVMLPWVNSSFDIFLDTVYYTRAHNNLSRRPHNRGGGFTTDLHRYPLPESGTTSKRYRGRIGQQLSKGLNLSNPRVAPNGLTLAAALTHNDAAFLVSYDPNLDQYERLYPLGSDPEFKVTRIFDIAWSPNSELIAVDFIDQFNRKIGIYNLNSGTFSIVDDIGYDMRNPSFSPCGNYLFYSADFTGVFNIYRYSFKAERREQITNVMGGAFFPTISPDGGSLAFTSYEKQGFTIAYLDSFYVLDEIAPLTPPSLWFERDLPTDHLAWGVKERSPLTPQPKIQSGAVKNYSPLPRKPIVIPTYLREAVLTEQDSPYRGVAQRKYGLVAGLMDPLAWADRGNSITFFYLTESFSETLYNKLFSTISDNVDPSENFTIARDFGVFLETKMFPVDLGFTWFKRYIPTTSEYVHNDLGYETKVRSDITIEPSLLQFQASHGTRYGTFTYFQSYIKQRANLNIQPPDAGNKTYLKLDVGSIYKNGLLWSRVIRPYRQASTISPYGFGVNFQYDFAKGKFVDEERIITIEDGKIKSNLHTYHYHTFSSQFRQAQQSFLVKDFDAEINFNATYLHIPRKTEDRIDSLRAGATNTATYTGGFPSFFQPAVHIPGYSFTYRADSTVHYLRDAFGEIDDSTQITRDSLVASGNVLLQGSIAYRFPLWRGPSIDKKLGFIYLDNLYGGVNFGGALTADNFTNLKEKSHEDILLHVGAELRLRSIAFNSFPLAITASWDRGLSKKAPIGGDRFTLSLGFDFDNWSIITQPTGHWIAPKNVQPIHHYVDGPI